MNRADEEAIRVLEAVGHLEQAEQLREELSMAENVESIKISRSALIYILAKTIEEKACAKAYFPCHACVFTAKSILDVVVTLMQKMSIYTFIDLSKETDLRKALLMAFHYAVSSTKKKLGDRESIQKLISPPKEEKKQEESLKIVKISENKDD